MRCMLQVYISNVSDVCCKSRSEYCICCNSCTCMLQASIPNVSSVFLDVCRNCVYLDVAYVSHICCNYFIWIFRMFAMVFKCFRCMF
jgi:hypothetical protein